MSSKPPTVAEALEADPKASLSALETTTGLTRPTVIKHRRAWLAAQADDGEGDAAPPEGKAQGEALQTTFPPTQTAQPKPPPEVVQAQRPLRVVGLRLGR